MKIIISTGLTIEDDKGIDAFWLILKSIFLDEIASFSNIASKEINWILSLDMCNLV
jgi:hypothetical protein